MAIAVTRSQLSLVPTGHFGVACETVLTTIIQPPKQQIEAVLVACGDPTSYEHTFCCIVILCLYIFLYRKIVLLCFCLPFWVLAYFYIASISGQVNLFV